MTLEISITVSMFSLQSLHAEDLTAKSDLSTLFYTDTNTNTATEPLSGSNWKLTVDEGIFTLNDGNDSASGNTVISIAGDNGSLNEQA